ncbi:MAG: nucleotide modification associated domain-containing protein [Candidatus Paceibacterota bacterium]
MAKTTPPKYLDDAFAEICDEMLATFISKHKDYGKGNILDTGELGIVFRINDKLRRLQNLRESGKTPANEAIEDTWMDIGVYAVLALLLKSGKFKKLNLNPKV